MGMGLRKWWVRSNRASEAVRKTLLGTQLTMNVRPLFFSPSLSHRRADYMIWKLFPWNLLLCNLALAAGIKGGVRTGRIERTARWWKRIMLKVSGSWFLSWFTMHGLGLVDIIVQLEDFLEPLNQIRHLMVGSKFSPVWGDAKAFTEWTQQE